MSVGLVWQSAAKSNAKLVNQKLCPLDNFQRNYDCEKLGQIYNIFHTFTI